LRNAIGRKHKVFFMLNPFDEISSELREIKELLLADKTKEVGQASQPIEVIDTETLCSRLNITEPTAIRHRKRGLIPFLQIGSSVRYDWHTVVAAIEKPGKTKSR
jgi:hypothetical protein